MTPVYDLNQPSSSFPFVEIKEDVQHLQLFLSPHHHHAAVAAASSFSSGPTFFNTAQDHTVIGESSYHHDHEVDKCKSQSRSSDHGPFSSSSSYQATVYDNIEVHKWSTDEDHNYKGSGDGSDKWMPSKMRIMHKMMNSRTCSESNNNNNNNKPVKCTPKFQDHQQSHANNSDINSSSSNSNNSIRVCSDCNTTTTPLWRSGPRGPKSLCNACGIRQRKARRAMAAATAATENGSTVIAMETSSIKTTKFKEKKPRTSHHAAQCKKLCKPSDHHPPHNINNNQGQKTKISFKNLALRFTKNSALQRVFPQDVEEAAMLLMELSCGFIHS